MKKILSFFLLALFVLGTLALLYLFVTKGYQGGKVNLENLKNAAVENIVSVSKNNEESSAVTSNKISLNILSPKDGSTLNSTNVVVTGKTTPNADVFINDVEGKADSTGIFSISIGLEEGQNQIIINANDKDGNVAEEVLNINIASF